jgi:hypothetical protein
MRYLIVLLFAILLSGCKALEDTDLGVGLNDIIASAEAGAADIWNAIERSDVGSAVDDAWECLSGETQALLDRLGIEQDDWNKRTPTQRKEVLNIILTNYPWNWLTPEFINYLTIELSPPITQSMWESMSVGEQIFLGEEFMKAHQNGDWLYIPPLE